jgi:hypothetical protein
MNLITRIAAAVIFLFGAACANATEAYHTGRLKFVYALGDGSYVIGFLANSAACTSSEPTKYMYITAGQNGVTADGLKNMIATALLGYATGGALSIAFDNSTSYCYINRLSLAEQ